MKLSALLLVSLLLLAPALPAGAHENHDHHGHGQTMKKAKTDTGATARTTEKGLFSLELAVNGKTLKKGPNSLDITVRGADGKPLQDAEITVVPWMPTMGHGVWDKPVVTARPGGGYHVENVMIIMEGRWDLQVTVKKGELQDRAVFSHDVADDDQGAQSQPKQEATGYERSVKYYNIPNVTLLNQDGKKVNLRALMDAGKPVIVDFIFTTCTTICPVLTASLSNLRNELGDKADGVQLVSISIDPENDRPEQLREYRDRFNGGSQWQFLTGSRDDIGKVLKAFDAFIVDKMSHEPLYILHGANSDQWVRVKGLVKKAELLQEYRRIAGR